MHDIESDLITKIDRCKGCSRDEKIEENSCQYWIRINNNINTVPDMLIGKNNNIIKAATNQLIEYMRTKELMKNEQKLIGLKTLEGLEIELIRKQKIRENISQELVEVLRRNILRDKNKYTIYTDGAANKRNEEEETDKNMGIGWVQITEAQNWSEEEVALGVKGWPTSTTAEMLAIWAAILTIPKGKKLVIFTDSNAAIRNISKGLAYIDRNEVLKKKNALWVLKIIDIVKTKNIQIEWVKVKSHSKNRWNDKADSLAKKGTLSKKIIFPEEVSHEEIEYCLEWENKRIDIPARLLCKIVTNARLGVEWKETIAIKNIEPEEELTIYDWTYFWRRLNSSKGVHCLTRRSSTRRSAFMKCILDKLPTLEELNRRRPDIYTTAECQVCQSKVKETQEHLASCKGQANLWKRIQKVSIATAWNSLKEEEKIRVPP
jgi:ribonuclease HI